MKKSALIFSGLLIGLSITAFGLIGGGTKAVCEVKPDAKTEKEDKATYTPLFYDVSSRFSPIKKEELLQARSVQDFLDEEQLKSIVSFYSVSVIYIEKDVQTEIRAVGDQARLNENQLKLLKSFDYSTNFLIRADFQQMDPIDGSWNDNYSTPHLTVVPQKEATYAEGVEKLIHFLWEGNKENTLNLDKDQLKSAKLYFTISENGEVTKLNLDRSCGYKYIDQKMMDLIQQTTGKWEAAENSKGEKVEQELVVSFGMEGC